MMEGFVYAIYCVIKVKLKKTNLFKSSEKWKKNLEIQRIIEY